MNNVIYKYPLQLADGVQTLKAPGLIKFLNIIRQGNGLVAYFIVDTDCHWEESFFYTVVGTGHPIDRDGIGTVLYPSMSWKYLTTVIDGPFVWHIFGKGRTLE